MSIERPRRPWLYTWRISGISISALLVLVFFLYQPTVLYLMGLWNRLDAGEYGHGYLVIAISLFLIVRNRRRLITLTPCPSTVALLAVAGSSLLWFMAVLVDISVIQSVALLLLVLAIAWALLGNELIRQLAFPILFIGFALPIWYLLSPLLQDIAADVVFWVIRLLEVPAFRHEHTISLPAGSLSIEEACSGLRYLLAGLTLSTLYAYLSYTSTRARLVVVLVTAVAAIVANILRVFIVVYLGYTTEMQHPYVREHLMLGWYLFGGLMLVLLLLDARLFRSFSDKGSSAKVMHEFTEQGGKGSTGCNKGPMQHIAVLLATVLIVSIAPASAYVVKNPAKQDELHAEMNLPKSMGGWAVLENASDDWKPIYHGAITRKNAYQKNDKQVHVFVGYYPGQEQGEELINRLNRITNMDVWHMGYSRARSLQIGDQDVMEQMLEKDNGEKRLVWYWYHVAGHRTTSIYEAKLLQIMGLLTGTARSFVIAVAAGFEDSPENTRKVLEDFIVESESSIARMIEETA